MSAAADGSWTRSLAEIAKRLEALDGAEHIAEDYVRFRIALARAQWSVLEALQTRASGSPGGGDGQRGASNGPLLDAQIVLFDRELLRGLYAALCDVVAKPGRQGADLRRLSAAAKQEPTLLEELARNATFGPQQPYLESLAARLDLPEDVLLFFGRLLAAPFVAEVARRTGRLSSLPAGTPEGDGQCLVCGSPPALAELRRDDGKRILHCSLCGARREFTRLACPYCGNRDRDGLTFLRVSDADPRWVEICDKCRRYIKTVDMRKLPDDYELIPLVEETATLHLDLLAEKEGCARGVPYAACG